MYQKFGKRLLDLCISVPLLVLLLPLLAVVAIVVKITVASPILFLQQRPGLNEKLFYVLKFRTMTNAVDVDGKLLPDSERLTSVGKFIRK